MNIKLITITIIVFTISVLVIYYQNYASHTLITSNINKISSALIITEKTKYHMGEQILIIVQNIGTEQIVFPGNPPFGIKNSKNESICCSGTEGILTILPNKESTYVWNQLNIITSKQTEPGEYRIFIRFTSENYPENIYEVSKWIEIVE